MADNLFRKAAELVRAGQRDEARRILAAEVNEHPDNADAWMALARLADDRERAMWYLEKVLEVRPGDEQAQGYLTRLKERAARPEAPTPTPEPAPTPPVVSRRRVRLLPVLAILAGLLIVGLAGGALIGVLLRGATASPGAGSAPTVEVMYRVTTANATGGFNQARLVYLDEGGRTVEESINRRSWSLTFAMPRGSSASIVIEDLGTTSSTVTCEILINGEIWRQEEASGRQPIAACAGTVGER